MTCDEIDELSGAIALGAVPEEEWPAIREHLATCTRGHPEVRELSAVAALLLEAAPPVDPPAGLRARILAAALAEPAAPTPLPAPAAPSGTTSITPAAEQASTAMVIDRRDRSFWQQGGWIATAAAAVLAVALGLWAVSLNRDLRDTEDRLSAAEQRIQRHERVFAALAGGRGVAFAATIPNARGSVVTPSQGNAALVVQGLPQSPGQVYQVWALTDGRPTSLGIFSVDDEGSQVIALDQDLRNVDTVAITLEPGPNGSPGPTSPVLLAAPLRG